MAEIQKIFLNALNSIPGIGYHTLKKIKNYFASDFERGFKASRSDFEKAGITGGELKAILNYREKIDPEKEFKKLEKENIKIITFADKNYPRLLKEIPLAPIFFYLKGELKEEDDFSFAIVGTRLATSYGKEVARGIALGLAQAGLTIVSGMALGIDTFAHQAALEMKKRTIAVLASGLDDKSIFPPQNIKLAHQIIENGALISEYPLGMEATKEKFPFRNRIISGLARGVLVVEAPLKSGSLITAKCALDQNRDVFAIPGNIFSKMSYGTNLLIKQGAKVVTRVEDILEELNLKYEIVKPQKLSWPTDEIEKIIFDILRKTGEPMLIDEIVRMANLPVSKIGAALIAMEMRGIVKNLGSGKFILIS